MQADFGWQHWVVSQRFVSGIYILIFIVEAVSHCTQHELLAVRIGTLCAVADEQKPEAYGCNNGGALHLGRKG